MQMFGWKLSLIWHSFDTTFEPLFFILWTFLVCIWMRIFHTRFLMQFTLLVFFCMYTKLYFVFVLLLDFFKIQLVLSLQILAANSIQKILWVLFCKCVFFCLHWGDDWVLHTAIKASSVECCSDVCPSGGFSYLHIWSWSSTSDHQVLRHHSNQNSSIKGNRDLLWYALSGPIIWTFY